ncbi:MAG: hypothetical protein KGH57_01205 [Candidatus Micrarchaeota archaeon]|nr:hypothetical protein [Candidatus Micrarchaeota archaeon]
MRAQASLEFLLIGSAVAAMSLFLIGFYSKNLFSQTSALAAIANRSPNASYQQPPVFFNYSPLTTTYSYASYSAAISNRSERLSYGIGAPSPVINLTQFSHCSYHGFYGGLLNISQQCGTSNAWEYLAGYDCWYSGAYCIIPHELNFSTETIAGQRAYAYNFTLTLESPLGTMRSEISSGENSSRVMLGGSVVGSASVSSVSSADPVPSVALADNSGSYTTANQTILSIYSQDKNTLFPMLAFYNGTGVGGETQASIEQAIGAYASAQLHLVESNGTRPACAVSGSAYTCNAVSPFLYLVNVTLSPSLGPFNQTVYYLGSVIDIKS